MSRVETTPLDPSLYRSDFPILQSSVHGDRPLVYLDNAASSQRPRQVIDAIVEMYEQHYANVHRGIHWLSEQSTDLYEQSRVKTQQFIHARQPHEIIFTTGTTAAVNLVARSWGDQNVKAGDHVLLTEMEHHSNIVPWQQLAERTGCQVRFLPISDDGQLRIDQLDQYLTERTRIVALTAASNVLGTINPIAEIARRAHEVGAVVLVDGAQSVPHSVTDVQASDIDFLAFSGHKMMGPSGVGVLYGKEQLLDAMPPFLGGGSMIHRVTTAGFEPAELPAKFEAGTPPIAPAYGLAAAIDYLLAVGLDQIALANHRLVQRTHDVFEQLGGIRILGPDPTSSDGKAVKEGIVSFVVDGVHAHDVAQILDRHGVAIRAGHHCAMPLHKRLGVVASNRASFYFYNTLDEVDRLGEALTAARKVFRRGR